MTCFERHPGQGKAIRMAKSDQWKNRQLTLEQLKERKRLKKLARKRKQH